MYKRVYGNTKLSYNIVDKMMKDNLTSLEIDFLLYFSLRQNSFGQVNDLYYKNVCLDLNCSYQAFYNTIYSLENKGYIRIEYARQDEFWVVHILDNMFLNDDDDKKGYFNTNSDYLYSKDFRNLKANEKKLCILFEKFSVEGRQYRVTINKLASHINLKSVSLIYDYLENISMFFDSELKYNKYTTVIYVKKNADLVCKSAISEKEHFLLHKIKMFCQKYSISYTLRDIKDLIILISQYAKFGISRLYSIIVNVLMQYKTIEPALINFLLNPNRRYNNKYKFETMYYFEKEIAEKFYNLIDLDKIDLEFKRFKYLYDEEKLEFCNSYF